MAQEQNRKNSELTTAFFQLGEIRQFSTETQTEMDSFSVSWEAQVRYLLNLVALTEQASVSYGSYQCYGFAKGTHSFKEDPDSALPKRPESES